jgi:thiamine-monophosphate kinase
VKEALRLAAVTKLHAMIDLSDGLAADVAKLCAESGCGAELWAEAVPISDDARRIGDGRSALEHALGDGEDFELAFAVAADEGRRLEREQPVEGVTLTAVGEVVAEGLWLREGEQRRPLAALGWVHELG